MSYLPPVWTLANYVDIFLAAHTGVFWDINDFSLPCLDPHVVYENIKSTLLNKFINYTHAIWDFVDSPALQDFKPVIIAANIDAFFILKDLPPPNFTKVFADGDALPEHLIRGYICSNLHVDIVPKGKLKVLADSVMLSGLE
ncbi:hypothetical protein F2Q69_00037954 [Brassica cretica]|uniref:Uncharacterized protein n=1 Tax=Brassica cretica TaxID=69181 RepID=A0A8S9SII4_BRACR|nr:hypothetical protein F2Q69_00037954 [Brassica cretica]